MTDYGARYGANYLRGRRLPYAGLAQWADAIASRMPSPSGRAVDLGAGTGRFSRLLAERIATSVVAVEPSVAMWRQAQPAPGVHWLHARAERLPLATGTCDLVWASQVVHHLTDPAAATAEVVRVLRNGGRLLVRGTFGDSFERVSWLPWFPEARVMADEYGVSGFVAAAARARLHLVAHDHVTQVVAADLAELYDRTAARADSALGALDDDAFERGLARLAADAKQQTVPSPVTEQLDLLTYERR